ncbi:zinc finger protein 143-like [Haliotis rubra]|uniref:zinc finger protein 143-like n=1 Tax=Haliotis rubra TaxID=36100 RepID=UPI001EE5C372|nr:zinc finger protein 143-like [Haliotis rubra]
MEIEDLESDLPEVESDHMSPLPSETDGIGQGGEESCDPVHTMEGVDESIVVADIDEHSSEVAENETEHTASVSMMDPTASELANAIPVSSQQVIGLLLQANEQAENMVNDPNNAQQISVSVSLPEGTVVATEAGQTVQAVTLADGTTAFIQHPRDAKFLEGQTVTLEDGSTAVVQGIAEKVGGVDPSTGEKMVESQPIQLEDGTTAYLQPTSKAAMAEGLQAITLEDGTTAYIAHPNPEALFGEAATLDGSALSLEHLSQVSAEQAHAHINHEEEKPAANPTTITVLGQGCNRIATEKALAIGEKAYGCAYEGCGRLYTTLHHLKVHERSHTGDRPFKCEFLTCGKAFATGYGLKSHTRVHTGEKPYKCPEDNCDKAFKTSGDLQKHVRTHTGERPFKCPFEGCDRSFTTSNIRKVHIRTHTGERPYVCQVDGCGRAFASATNYKNHVRIHTGEKPYVCTVQGCNKRFTEYSSLYKHHVVHTHSKPYICNHCGKTYRQTSTLAMHKRTAHGEDTTAESEAQLFAQQQQQQQLTQGEEGEEPASKRSRLQVTLAGGGTSQEEGEGTLVINTSEPQQVAMVSAEGVVEDAGGMGMVTLHAPSQVALQQLQQAQGIASITVGDQGQQVLVVTDPSQLEAIHASLQQLAAGQAQFTTTEAIETAATSSAVASAPQTTSTSVEPAMIMFQAE